jgi:hypothetical protein
MTLSGMVLRMGVAMNPGCNCIHSDAFGAELAAPGFGESDDTKFGGGVIGLPKITVDAHDRTGIHDGATALRHHDVSDQLAAMENAAQVDVNHWADSKVKCNTLVFNE